MTAQDLKNSILQLAIQGKLVKQRPEEGTAKELLEQIKAEKEQLIKGKRIKVEKLFPEITEDEIPFEIPDSWEWVRLGDIIYINSGNGLTSKEMQEGEIPVFGGNGITGYHNKANVSEETVVIGRVGFYCGSIHVTPKVAWVTDNAFVTKYPINQIDRTYLVYILQHLNLGKSNNATAQPVVSGKKIYPILFPIPPLEEQKRIVAKIEGLLPYVEQYDKAYCKLEVFNKKFPEDMQKSILQYAIQGKLVEQRPEEGTAEELYQQIQAEKAKLIKEGKIKKEKPLGEITDEEIPFEIPESWKWVRLQQVGELSRGKSKHRPRNDVRLFENGTFPLIQTGDVARADRLVKEYNTMYNDFGVKQSRIWRKGTVCLTIAANIGDVAILDFDACFPDSVVGFNAFEPIVSNKFFLYGLMCYKEILGKMSRSTAQKNINIDILSRVAFPLPPLKEQERIVLKIEELLPYSQQLKK